MKIKTNNKIKNFEHANFYKLSYFQAFEFLLNLEEIET